MRTPGLAGGRCPLLLGLRLSAQWRRCHVTIHLAHAHHPRAAKTGIAKSLARSDGNVDAPRRVLSLMRVEGSSGAVAVAVPCMLSDEETFT